MLSSEAQKKSPNGTVKVMLVDDSVLIRKYVSQILCSLDNIEVAATAPNGKIGLQKLFLYKPDVIILDIEMPEMSGLEFLKYLKEKDFDYITESEEALLKLKISLSKEMYVDSANNEITCDVNGPVRLLGMEDSNPANTEDYKDNKQKAFHGKLLIYLQATDKPGAVTIKLSSPGLKDSTVLMDVK